MYVGAHRKRKFPPTNSSVASFLLLGGGGGASPPNVPTEEKNVYVSYMHERASASEIYVFSGLKIHLHTYIQSMQWSGAINHSTYTDKTLANSKKFMNMRASGASELKQFSHLLCLKLLFPSKFCW